MTQTHGGTPNKPRSMPLGPIADDQCIFRMEFNHTGWHWKVTNPRNHLCLTGWAYTKTGARWAMRRAKKQLLRTNGQTVEWVE